MPTDAPLTIQRIAIFPLPGAVLFPGLHLPLHIFEPRYKAMVQEVLARDRQIGMIQPRQIPGEEDREPPRFTMLAASGASSTSRRWPRGGSTSSWKVLRAFASAASSTSRHPSPGRG